MRLALVEPEGSLKRAQIFRPGGATDSAGQLWYSKWRRAEDFCSVKNDLRIGNVAKGRPGLSVVGVDV